MAINRRTLLISGGASAVILGSLCGAAWWPGSASATAPWRAAGQSLGDPRLDALAFAILAPNPHNRQPWQFRLVGDDRVDVLCDLDRRLPATDPFDRQIVVGFGGMIELFTIAAAAGGFRTETAYWPDSEPQPRLDARRIASLRLVRDRNIVADPLFEHIVARRSTKSVYDDRPVSADVVRQLIAGLSSDGPPVVGLAARVQAGGSVAAGHVAALRDLTWSAWMIEYQTAATRRESVDLMRIGNAEVAANPDGIELGGMFMGLGKMVGAITREQLDTPGSSAYQQGIDMFEPILRSAQGHVWLISADASRAAQLAAGRRWVRINLKAQQLGLAVHPLSQPLQEFPEMAANYAAVHRQLGAAGGAVVQMLGRIGYAAFPEPTPRWPLETHLVTA